MATVYLAQDLRHERSVALKVLHPELAESLGPERFQREIKLVARLQHPHILTVHDSGEAAGCLWFTMPYVEGESLRARLLRERQLPVEEALRITIDAARALQYAHEHGVIHRDIKPENLLLTKDGSTLVADFGIARALSGSGEQLTQTGMSVGTPAYMSPEQGAGDPNLDARTDVYSLGTVLYEMLAGEPPFTGATAQVILAKRCTGEVPRIRHLRPSVPQSVEHAVTKALGPVAADRYVTAAAFALALQQSTTITTPATAPVVATPRRQAGMGARVQRRLPVAATTLVLGFLIGLGVLFAWRRTHTDSDPSSAKLIAVLPFENLGDSADAYFADGVANEVRTKLSQVAGLAVIARGSSNEYRKTTKTQHQIARELGVDYLLTATVQWEKGTGGASRVRVTPELVDVRPGHRPQVRWGQPFDAALTGVFQVQADIAGQVAQALNVALGDSTRRELAARPTQSLPAYDALLRGNALDGADPPTIRRAIASYEQAVALDSTFAAAWAALAASQATLYYNSVPTPARADAARRAAERALALAPNRPESHVAMANYYNAVLGDYRRSFREDSIALSLAPERASLLGNVGLGELSLGRWAAGREHLEQAVRLDPRNGGNLTNIGFLLLSTRDYSGAVLAFDRALQLKPGDLLAREYRAMVALAQGDISGARAVLRAAPKELSPTTLVAFVGTYWDLGWALDDAQQQLLLRLTPSAFDDDRAAWAFILAQTYWLRGDHPRARAYADSARVVLEEQLRATPQDDQRRACLGLVLAYLGRKEAAVREGQHAVALLPVSSSPKDGPYTQHQLVRIYMVVGEQEKALDQLEPLLKIPYYLSPGWLRIDPNFAPLRGNPRFERLVNGK